MERIYDKTILVLGKFYNFWIIYGSSANFNYWWNVSSMALIVLFIKNIFNLNKVICVNNKIINQKKFYFKTLNIYSDKFKKIEEGFFKLLRPTSGTLYKKLRIKNPKKKLLPNFIKIIMRHPASKIEGVFLKKNGKKYYGYIIYTSTENPQLIENKLLKLDSEKIASQSNEEIVKNSINKEIEKQKILKISNTVMLLDDETIEPDVYNENDSISDLTVKAAENVLNKYAYENDNNIKYTENLNLSEEKVAKFEKKILGNETFYMEQDINKPIEVPILINSD